MSLPLPPSSNRLLASLPPSEYRRLVPHLEQVDLPIRKVLFDVDEPIEHVYFPQTAVASILGVMSDGTGVEVATVGREGMVGVPVFLGAERMSAQCFVQVPGQGLRMRARELRRLSQHLPGLHDVLERYTQALFTFISQGAACNRTHTTEQRCTRWLLMTADRVGVNTLDSPSEFLAQMLGVRRASVSEVASVLQREGLLRYSRGHITLLDRAGMEATTCECYGIVLREFQRLLEKDASGKPRARPRRR